MNRWGKLASMILGLTAALAVWVYSQFRPPTSRLSLDAYYPEMAPDEAHHYINLPVDYARPDSGLFRDFYLLSPGFQRGDPIVFFLTDGQMELVGLDSDADFINAQLPGLACVLIGHRGHSPTLFPEVYENGRINLQRALTLYGSWQRVEDIERVRLDMSSRGLLPADGKIMIYGASGAGVLAQQYLHRYGSHVSRVLLSVTGAPDLAARLGVDYARDFNELDPEEARMLNRAASSSGISSASLAFLTFQLGREGIGGRAVQRQVIESLASGRQSLFWRLWLKPSLNLPLNRFLLGNPRADAVRVRMFELMGADLRRQTTHPRSEIHLLYQWASEILADYLASGLLPPSFQIDRRRFMGEVLVVSALDDVVFSPAIGREIAREYQTSRFVAVKGGHRLTDNATYHATVRRAFFQHGLRSKDLQALLDAPP